MPDISPPLPSEKFQKATSPNDLDFFDKNGEASKIKYRATADSEFADAIIKFIDVTVQGAKAIGVTP